MDRITLYRRKMALRFWLLSDDDERTVRALRRLEEAEIHL